MNKDSRIYIAGHKGMVGFALLRNLENNDWNSIAQDLNKNLIKGFSGSTKKEEIIKRLAGYGIKAPVSGTRYL